MTSVQTSLLPVVSVASEMLMLGETNSVLAGINTENEAAYFVLLKDPAPERQILCDVSEVLPIVEKGGGLRSVVEELLMIRKGNA
jgi:hypothetical protein